MNVKLLTSALAAASLLAVPAIRAFAQDAPTPAMAPMSANDQTKPNPDAIDYSVLNGKVFTYQQLRTAKARSFSDHEIAKMVKIAEMTGCDFGDISDAVQGGATFSQLGEKYGINPGELKHDGKQMDEVAAYITAYESIGRNEMRTDKM